MGLSVDIDAANTVNSNISKTNTSGVVPMDVNEALTAAVALPQKNDLNELPSQAAALTVIKHILLNGDIQFVDGMVSNSQNAFFVSFQFFRMSMEMWMS